MRKDMFSASCAMLTLVCVCVCVFANVWENYQHQWLE